MSELREIAVCAEDAAVRAGRLIVGLRSANAIHASTKGDSCELVTSADLASNDLIREATRIATPEAQYLSEEGEECPVDWHRPVWVVDPLDGTVNYVYGNHHVAVAIAYVVGGEVQVGVVHAPFQDETFVAVRGAGAKLNGVGLGARSEVELADALVATGFPHKRVDLEPMLQRFSRVVRACRDVRRLASPSLDICWVAAGRLDATYETLRPWDVAAAGLIAREVQVSSAHYADDARTADVPAEARGDSIVFARPRLLRALLPVLEAGADDASAKRPSANKPSG